MGRGQSPISGRLAHNRRRYRHPPSSPPRRGACLGLDGGCLYLHYVSPARRRRTPAPRHPPCGWGSKATAAATLAGGGPDCAPPQGLLGSNAAMQPEGRLGTGRKADRCEPRGGATPGRRVRSQSRAAQPAPQAWLCWRGWAERRRPGPEGRTAPTPPKLGGWAPRSTYAATGTGEEQCKPAPQGRLAWACIAGGLPCATAGGWQAPQARRPEPPPTLRSSCRRRRLGGGDQPPHAPDCRRQAGRAAAPPPPRVGRGTPRRARGREGRPRLQAGVDGSPLSPLSGRSEAIRDPPACKAGGSCADRGHPEGVR